MPRKTEDQQLVSLSWQCSSTLVTFAQSKEQCDNAGASPILSWPGTSWFLNCFLNWNQHRRDCTFVTSLRMLWKSWKDFLKMASRNISNTFTVTEVCRCTRGLFWRKFSLSDCTVLCFAEIKWFQEHFEATTYNSGTNCIFQYNSG